ncbi:MAG: 30S ribosomal protein S9 [Candidatus Zambryskibacteria bacterium RIFCSPLOWO2_01_FULL_39_39]|uniref:Small ribosomal subunit protein uS9 n=1 Tax=Candidatus Zambryskibacteria bacterium RIFCSPLOWO2_01_FULL_39_39 TaxID=1802758 RepID=A0A1G2TX31_9BACT|nr:MAG: 30S ribosomal protein S9 [Parcubacteria group bacterium GW2011_GWA1_38_7]OHA87857.1 MAG: 30S ribosomal protein S9 [Candidatus Zambryskibacteria bacterium RIFCSPHIGHO2_01_FULL_39_63]OHA94919.1 MAG: 30S ribosomal protein S9 [Candidatus Zambryskibacteria bacterium RIFCSPHIGHO2_02_FULL_39_19]OHA99099.1 MAG: 30S ribosomal protein S9 [Candidatus Zambryskibacteria bacterium RIFCSPHIGHO2_12_FULL_39_21]OHB01861.1 MAG: 30S ribosomal protein S9 [Candidatus Zambryskibacteria bacterium RIFCSPLOWO2_0
MPITKEKTADRYTEAVGRRKTASARVRITPASKNTFKINDRDLASYFPTAELRKIIEEATNKVKVGNFNISIHVKGGGVHSQAEAVRHGISRALVKHDESSKTKLKTAGFLKRDPRAKERRKFGLKKARKAPQWSKR